jgi:large subunit ribosomal protein L35
MPKLKSNSGAKKRFSLTSKGKVKRAKAFASHLLESKNQKRKRGLRGTTTADVSEVKKVKRMLPYA